VPVNAADKAVDRLEPEALNDTDKMELSVYANEKYGQVILTARLDNLARRSGARAEPRPDAGAGGVSHRV